MLGRTRPRSRSVAIIVAVPALLIAGPIAALSTAGSAVALGSARTQAAAAASTVSTLMVGVPDSDRGPGANSGAVEEYLPDGSTLSVDEKTTGLAPGTSGAGARFGAALAPVNLNRDVNGYADLVVGAPRADNRPGRVDVLFGGAGGITGTGARTITAGENGDEFGAALAVTARLPDENGARDASAWDLWVGAPGHDIGGHKDAGAVYRYALAENGQTTLLDTITQNSPLVPGSAETGDRFGEVLAAQEYNRVEVGVPHEDVGSARDAGELVLLHTDYDTNALGAATVYTQNTPGVPGSAEAGDRFGAALAEHGFGVGVPGEDVGKRHDAGAVQSLDLNAQAGDDPPLIGLLLTQDSPGVPGRAEAGDRFGAALAYGTFNCDERPSLAIGAPGEDIGSIKDAGSVTLRVVSRRFPSPQCTKMLSQGSGLPGASETGDQLGAALGAVRGLDVDPSPTYNPLLIGDPGEDIGTAKAGRNTGRAIIYLNGASQSVGSRAGDAAGLRYGSVLGSDMSF